MPDAQTHLENGTVFTHERRMTVVGGGSLEPSPHHHRLPRRIIEIESSPQLGTRYFLIRMDEFLLRYASLDSFVPFPELYNLLTYSFSFLFSSISHGYL
jgi:hypothetical protein